MSRGVSILLWLSLTMAIASDDHQYCQLRYRRLCKGKGRHVACQFSNPGAGPSCQNYTYIKFTKDLRHFTLHYINRRRQRIAAGLERVRGGLHLPKPEIMMLVDWDRELALLAQRLADQCHFVHDDCRATVRFPYAGQTVGEVRWRRLSDSEEISAQRAVRRVFDAWWGERRRVEPKHLTMPFRLTSRGAVWGHFTQLAVWNLRAVGCGAVRHGTVHPRLLLVCDFSHTNMLGQRTLTPGPLAPCPIHTARRPRSAYPLLCAPVPQPVPPGDEEPDPYTEDDQYEDEEDGDFRDDQESETVIVGEVPTPTGTNLWVRKKYGRVHTDEMVKKEDDELIRMRVHEKAQTQPAMIDKLQRELEIRNNRPDKIKPMKHQKPVLKHDETRRPPQFGHWRRIQEGGDDEMPRITKSRTPYSITERTEEADLSYVPISRVYDINDDNLRPRWKQTRVRHRRPGANALVVAPTEINIATPIRRQSAASLMLDQDDVEQLFKDTGFSMSWKKKAELRAG